MDDTTPPLARGGHPKLQHVLGGDQDVLPGGYLGGFKRRRTGVRIIYFEPSEDDGRSERFCEKNRTFFLEEFESPGSAHFLFVNNKPSPE